MAFPTNPTDGQLYNENGVTWLYVSPPGVWTKAGGTPITIDESDPVFAASPAASYTEAPIDGTPYSRQDGGWVAAGSGGGATVIDDLTDVDTTTVAPVGGDVLKWNGTVWAPTTDDDTVYTDADVDTHLNTSTATNGQILSYTGGDYDWIDAGGGGGLAWETTTVFGGDTVNYVPATEWLGVQDVDNGYVLGSKSDNTSFSATIRLFGGTQKSYPYHGGMAHYAAAQTVVYGRNAVGLAVDGGKSVGINGSGEFAYHGDALTTPKFKVNTQGEVTFNNAFTFPNSDGTANQVLTTNGSGTVTWQTPAGGGGGDAADLYDKGWTSTQGKTDTGVAFDLTNEDFWFEVRVFIDSAATFQNLFTLGGDGASSGGIKGQFLCYKTNSRGITMVHSTTGDSTSGTSIFNNDQAGLNDDQWVTITVQRASGVVTGWINGNREYNGTPTAFTGSNTGGKIWFWTYADGLTIGTGDECRISDFRFEKSPATLPYLNTDLSIEPTLGTKPALPSIDESGRIEVNDWITTSNNGGEDRFFFKAGDGASGTPTWRGQAGGGFQFNIFNTNESITFSDGADAVEITGRHNVTGGVEGLRINGIGGGTTANQTVFIATDGTDRMLIRGPNIIMPTLPTSDPAIAGALWNNAGVLNISAG